MSANLQLAKKQTACFKVRLKMSLFKVPLQDLKVIKSEIASEKGAVSSII